MLFSPRGESGRKVTMDVEAITAMATSLRCSDTLLVADHVLIYACGHESAFASSSRRRNVVVFCLLSILMLGLGYFSTHVN